MAKRTWFGLLFRSDITRVPEVIQKSAGVMWCCCVGFAGAVVWWCGGVSVWCFGVVVVPGVGVKIYSCCCSTKMDAGCAGPTSGLYVSTPSRKFLAVAPARPPSESPREEKLVADGSSISGACRSPPGGCSPKHHIKFVVVLLCCS